MPEVLPKRTFGELFGPGHSQVLLNSALSSSGGYMVVMEFQAVFPVLYW